MGILSWILMGLIAGAIAKLLMPGKDPGGFIITICIGVAGGFLGGFIGTQLGFGDITGFNFQSFIMAVGGAVILLAVYRFIKR
jgi:uncharacterized membrane protein YeaQ/YmgE (transglycosylase-associated protein family)